jgi:hypothetical protein
MIPPVLCAEFFHLAEAGQFCTCHYRKLRPDASKAVSINDTWRGRRVNRLPSHHRDLTGIENERRPDGSSPRRARSLDEKACFCLEKISIRQAGTTRKVWCHETAKPRAVRIDGAGHPPEES